MKTVLGFLLAAFSIACGARDEPSPPWDRAWLVDSIPLLDIGTAAGPEATQLHGVRGAQLLQDGTLAIGNAGSGEVRFYSPQGDFVRSVGARGDGPGELENLRWFRVLADGTTIAFDAEDRTVVTFAPDGTLEHVPWSCWAHGRRSC